MTSLALRTRDQPDIRAKISIHDESPSDIRQRLQIANQTQRALRSQQLWHPPEPNDSALRLVPRKPRNVPYPYRAGQSNDNPTSDPQCQWDRSNSLNSLSTLHREAEAGALSLYRGSPISAISPPPVAPTVTDCQLQDPCPPRPQLRIETFSEQRKYQKALKRSLKKQQKEELRRQKDEEKSRRAAWAAEVTAARKKDAAARGETLPLRSRTTRAIASQVVKNLSLRRPLSKLSRRARSEKADPPTLDDFDSKEEIRDYLNWCPATPSTALSTALSPAASTAPSARLSADIAELPAELPQYTPFQNSTRTQHNEPVTRLNDVLPAKEKESGMPSNQPEVRQNKSQTSPRSMRCDSCQSPIRLHQVYYHCSICEDGDRILCSSCDQAGWSCRHEITEKIRNVSRVVSPEDHDLATLNRGRSRSEAQQYAAATAGLAMADFSKVHSRRTERPLQASKTIVNPGACPEISALKKSRHASVETDASTRTDHAKDNELWRRERDMILREKEIALRERETAIREQQASLREQEAVLAIKQQLCTLQSQAAMVQRVDEASTGIGSQFQDLPSDDHVKNHGTKRKAGGDRASMPLASNSVSSNPQTPLKRSPGGGGREPDDEDDEESAGTPKKIKQTLDPLRTTEKLFACPFAKYHKSRYSEQNRHEKQYRGCSSGYWPDISRLKQHLYRVHWRKIYCVRCYTKFDNQDLLQAHLRTESCLVVDCPYPEKFDEAQYNEIRRKRPANTPEQVWYTIYGILFPNQPQPESPYADNVDTSPQSALSPAAAECQDAMEALGERFESRLDQYLAAPGQDWLRSMETREFIRQQLRVSMTEVLGRLNPAGSFVTANPSAEASPHSAFPPDSARRNSISLTPVSSIPATPLNGNQQRVTESNSHFLLPGHHQYFSRPLPARPRQDGFSVEQALAVERVHQPPSQSFAVGESMTGVTVPALSNIDTQIDTYDDECNSWSHGDELDHTIFTDFNFGFDTSTSLPSAIDEVMPLPLQPSTVQPPALANGFTPVKLSSVVDMPSTPGATATSQLKPNHSATSSIDSGYGSLGDGSVPASSSNFSGAPKTKGIRPKRENVKGTEGQTRKEPSPVPEEDINFDALDISLQEFLGGTEMDEFADLTGESLSKYLDTKYPAASGTDQIL